MDARKEAPDLVKEYRKILIPFAKATGTVQELNSTCAQILRECYNKDDPNSSPIGKLSKDGVCERLVDLATGIRNVAAEQLAAKEDPSVSSGRSSPTEGDEREASKSSDDHDDDSPKGSHHRGMTNT